MSLKEFSRASGLSERAISLILSGTTRKVRDGTYRKLAQGMGMTPGELDEHRKGSGLGGAAVRRGIPVINKVRGGLAHDFQDVGHLQYEWLPISTEVVGDPEAFACQVIGTSMEPDFREGDVVVFAPRAEVGQGDACFVQFNGDRRGENTFKRVYDLGDGRLELRPANLRDFVPEIVPAASVARVIRAVGVYHTMTWAPRR